MPYEKKALERETLNRLLATQNNGRYSWLSTENRKRILAAVNAGKSTVELDRGRRKWSKFKIDKRDNNKLYIFPTGKSAPFTPTAWLDLERLRADYAS